eukprot:COSAG01_NODE_20952_length_926_cov_0.864571_3_plen_22_part_01
MDGCDLTVNPEWQRPIYFNSRT